MGETRYKFAIMLNGLYLYPWQKKAFEKLIKDGLASCTLLIIRKEVETPSKSFWARLFNPSFLFEQFKKITLNNSVYKPLHIKEFSSIDQVEVIPLKKEKGGEFFSETDLEKIQDANPDFILRFGFGILKGDILKVAKWGVWSFHHGDEQKFRGGPAGFWEIMKGSPTNGTILQRLTEKLDAGKILLKREYQTVHHSYQENVEKLLNQSADMPAQALRMIDHSVISVNELEEVKTAAPVFRYPKNFQFIRFLIKLFFNKIRFKYHKLIKQENWMIGYRNNREEKSRYIAPKADGEYYADPFVFNDEQKTYIVAEHFSYRTKKGSIVLIEPGMNQTTTVLEKKTHLSYPFIFGENGVVYMLPEEAQSNQLHLYKWNRNMRSFDAIKPILDLPAVDASLLKHDGKYWLFTGLSGELPNEKLFIYYADQLEGPYLPHTSNPVKVTPAGSRMAGGFHIENGEIIRPSQYSVKYYGEKVVFQKITRLSTTEFKEEFNKEIKPMKDAPFKCGLHTYNRLGDFEVVDLKRMQSDYVAFKSQLS